MSRANVSSRVEDIKKRLEAASNAPLISPEKLLLVSANRQKNESAIRANVAPAFLPGHSDITRHKSPNASSSILPKHSEAAKRKSLSPVRASPLKLDRQLSSPGTRGNNVRRSPAFRCDKIVKGRNVVGQRPRSFVDTTLNRDEVKVKRLNSSPTKKPVKLLDSPKRNEMKGVAKPEITYPKPKPSISPPKALNDIPRNPKIEYAVVNKALKTKKNVLPLKNVLSSEIQTEETDINSGSFQTNLTKEDFQSPNQLAVLDAGNGKRNVIFSNKTPVYGVNENYSQMEECSENKYGKIANFSPKLDEPKGHEYGKISTAGNNLRREEPRETYPNEYGKVSLSNTLKAVLSSPLPPGPPPQKPPRTFAHAAATRSSAVHDRVQKFNNVAITSPSTVPKLSPKPFIIGKTANINEVANVLHPRNGRYDGNMPIAHANALTSPPQRPTRSKTESEIMLRKLENVLLNHQKSGIVIKPTIPPTAPSVKSSQSRFRHHLPDASRSETRKGCLLESFSCISRPGTYQRFNENTSEFFVEFPIDEARTNSNIRRSSSVEHIYAVPFEFSGKSPDERSALSLEARRKSAPRKILAITPEKIVEIGQFRGKMEEGNARVDEGGLHYLSSPVSSDPEATKGISSGEPEKSKALRPKPGLLRLAGLVRGTEKPNQEKIQQIMNQAFGVPHAPEVSESDNSPVSTPEESLDFESSIADLSAEITSSSGAGSLTDSGAELRQLTERRKTYVRRVSCRIAPTKQPHTFPHLFQYVLLVGLNIGCGVNKPYIKRKYPPDADVTPHIEEFCFPDASDWPRQPNANGTPDEQSYSLVITNDKGDRTFGYCRRVMPEGADVCLPLAYCIISPFRATGFYYKVLSELESRHGQPEVHQTAFIMELYSCSLPGPGQSLKPGPDLSLTSPVANTVRSTLESAHMVLAANFQANLNAGNGPNVASKMESYGATGENGASRGKLVHSSTIVRRPLDLRLEEQDLTQLFSAVSVSDLLLLFGSLLLERKVLLFSESLSKLSSCVEALQSILYPFSWQHTFIPVLPISQVEYCDAPTPYIFGLLKQGGHLPDVEITDGIAVDVDTSRVVISVGDEATILPTRLRRSLKTALQLVGQLTQPTEAARNVLVSEAFVRAFVEVCGHYQSHIIAKPDGSRHFEREAFVAAGSCRAERSFLEWFSETAMFRRFLEVRMERGSRFRGVFEQRARERKDEMEKNTVMNRPNKKHRTLGDRFKEWAPFT